MIVKTLWALDLKRYNSIKLFRRHHENVHVKDIRLRASVKKEKRNIIKVKIMANIPNKTTHTKIKQVAIVCQKTQRLALH